MWLRKQNDLLQKLKHLNSVTAILNLQSKNFINKCKLIIAPYEALKFMLVVGFYINYSFSDDIVETLVQTIQVDMNVKIKK